MKILISPAKNMNTEHSFLSYTSKPVFLNKSKKLVQLLQGKTINELKDIFKTNDKLTDNTYKLYQKFDFDNNLTPAIIAYDGIQYKYMGNTIFTNEEFEYLNDRLFIISALYGILRPLDGICEYRLEMINKLGINSSSSLYDYWGEDLYSYVFKNNDTVLSLLSNEYKKCFTKYLKANDNFIEVYFYEDVDGKLKDKTVYTKMARGLMVRYICINKIEDIEGVKRFNEYGYVFNEQLSNKNKLVFVRKEQ